jgi:hypothetical protein
MTEAEDVVWGGTIDHGKFTAKVVAARNNSAQGQLTVILNETGAVLLDEQVRIAFGAVFGVDIADSAEWQMRSITVIDEWYRSNGLQPPEGGTDG